MVTTETLRRGPLLERLTDTQLQRVAEHAHRIERDSGEALFDQGDPAQRFYLLLKGQIKLFRLSADGNEKVFEIVTPPGTFGEALMFQEHPHYPVSASALRPAELVAIDGRDFAAMLRQSTDTCFALMAHMSHRLHHLIREIDHLTLHSATCRVAGFIHDQAGDGRDIVDLQMSKGTLASLLSVTPETLSRIFKQLSARGVIEVSGRKLRIVDADRLRETAEG